MTVDHNFKFPVELCTGLPGSCMGSAVHSVDFTCSWCEFVDGRGARHKLSPSGLVLFG